MITIATGNGYWRENSWQTKRFVWWLWYVVASLVPQWLAAPSAAKK